MLVLQKIFLVTISQENFRARNISPLNFRPTNFFGLRQKKIVGHVLRLRGVCFKEIFFVSVSQTIKDMAL